MCSRHVRPCVLCHYVTVLVLLVPAAHVQSILPSCGQPVYIDRQQHCILQSKVFLTYLVVQISLIQLSELPDVAP